MVSEPRGDVRGLMRRGESVCGHVKVKVLSRVRLFATPGTVACQAPPAMGFFQARVWEWVAIAFYPFKDR